MSTEGGRLLPPVETWPTPRTGADLLASLVSTNAAVGLKGPRDNQQLLSIVLETHSTMVIDD
jgi:hypothetical protein